MYINIFKRNWMNDDIVDFMKTLPQGFTPFIMLADGTHKKLDFFDNDLYSARFVKYIGVYFMDEFTVCSFSVDHVLTKYDVALFKSAVDPFISAFKFEHKQPPMKTLIEREKQSKEEMIKSFNLTEKDLTEHMEDVLTINFNTCSPKCKEKLIEYLMNVNENSVPVDIQIDFSHAPVEEIIEHDNNVELAKI